MARGPQFVRYMLPILHVLREMGGSAAAAEVTDAVIEREQLPDHLLAQTNNNGQSKVRNQIAWARMYLVHSGHIDASQRGIWKLTERGQREELIGLDAGDLFRAVQRSFRDSAGGSISGKPETVEDTAPDPLEADDMALLPVIQQLSPIELVDGEKLVRMFEQRQLGVKPRVVYEVDLEFFKDFH